MARSYINLKHLLLIPVWEHLIPCPDSSSLLFTEGEHNSVSMGWSLHSSNRVLFDKQMKFITSRKCAYYLGVLVFIWVIIAVIPAMISSILYPPLPYIHFNEPPPVPILPSIAPEWQFWAHRIFADPLTKGIGAIPVIILLVVMTTRELLKKKE